MLNLRALLSLAAISAIHSQAQAQDVTLESEAFTVPQSCFSSGELVSTTKTSQDLADMTNMEELYSDVFDYRMRASVITICRTNTLGGTGVQIELTSPPLPIEEVEGDADQDAVEGEDSEVVEGDENGDEAVTAGGRTLVLAPIGNIETNCNVIELEEDQEVSSIELRYGSQFTQSIFYLSDGTQRKYGTAKVLNEKSTWTFTEGEKLIGFSGQYLDDRLSRIAVLTYKPECGETAYNDWVRANEEKARLAEEEKKKPDIDEQLEELEEIIKAESDLVMTLIIIISASVVAVLTIIIVCCCLMRRNKNKNRVIQLPAAKETTRNTAGLENMTSNELQLGENATVDDFNSKQRVHTESNMKLNTDPKDTLDDV